MLGEAWASATVERAAVVIPGQAGSVLGQVWWC